MHALVIEKARRVRRRRAIMRAGISSVAVVLLAASVTAIIASRSTKHPPSAVTTNPPNETTTTTTPPAQSVPPQLLTPALYPSYLPQGDLPAKLTIDTRSTSAAPANPGHVQSYYGDAQSDGTRVELLIEESQVGLGGDNEPATLGGHDVTLWHIGGDEILGVTTTVDDSPVTLIGLRLSTDDLGVILAGLHRSGRGWTTDSLPGGLTLVANGDDDVSYFGYILQFGDAVSLNVQHGALRPQDTCFCNGGPGRTISLAAVRARPAVLTQVTDEGPTSPTLFRVEWQYSRRTSVVVSVVGFGADEALKIAESVGFPTLDEVNALDCVKFSVSNTAGEQCNVAHELLLDREDQPHAPAIYPAYLPADVGPLSMYLGEGGTGALPSYTQTYFDVMDTSGDPRSLIIDEGYPDYVSGYVDSEPPPPAGDARLENMVDGKNVRLTGHGVSDAELSQVLSGLRARVGTPGWDTTVLPADLTQVGEGNAGANPPTIERYGIGYPPFDPNGGVQDRYVEVAFRDGAVSPGGCASSETGDNRFELILGQHALISICPSADGGVDMTVQRQLAPNIVVSVFTRGYPQGEAIRVAQSLQPATFEQWDSMDCYMHYRGDIQVAADVAWTVPCSAVELFPVG